jgi:hypothetical protein
MTIKKNYNIIKGGGSHQRCTKKALESAFNAENIILNCKCPFHYNNGIGTEIKAVEFNRCSKSNTGYQNMCASGKTEIDSFSHKLKRILSIVAFLSNDLDSVSSIIERIFHGIDNIKIKKNILKLILDNIKFSFELDENYEYILKQLLIIYDGDFSINEIEKISLSNFNILKKINILDTCLKSKNIDLYKLGLSLNELKDINKNILENTNKIQKLEFLNSKITEVSKGFYIKESKKVKDSIYYDADTVSINFSKLNNLYFERVEDNKVYYKKSIFKLNIHNTREKGQRTSTDRSYSYLSDGNFIEANRHMKKIGQNNKKIHVDHIVPLRLGGIHDAINLTPLIDIENIKKKDKLTEEAYELLKNNLYLISEYHREKLLMCINLNYDIRLTEQVLRDSVEEQILFVKSLSNEDKIYFLNKKYYLKKEKIERLIRKYFM